MAFGTCEVVLSAVMFVLRPAESAPLQPELNFEDDWNYQIAPHMEPLLKESTNKFLEVVYDYEKDLKVSPLEYKVEEEPEELRAAKKIGDVVRRSIPCGICKLGVGMLHREVKQGSTFDDIKEKFVALCVSFKIQIEPVCKGTFDVFGPDVLSALNVTKFGASDICFMTLGESCERTSNSKVEEWSIDLPEPTRKLPTRVSPEPGQPVFKVLQISDIHLDPDYVTGSPANCEEPICCRSSSTPKESETTVLAGRWGSYEKCDAPRILMENMLEHISLEHPDVDYILWTGDLPPHDIWRQTKESNLEIIKEATEQMLKYFPNTPIFPAVGNHESVPAGSFAPSWMKDPNHSIGWLYTKLAEHWKKWLPSSSTNTILHGGFFSVLLRPGFRLISLNTNYCHALSWWLMVNDTDPAKELKWLVYELQKAEDNGEKVHVIGHIAPGSSDCMQTWSKNFYQIVERYKDTITGMFYGHSHADEVEIFYETTAYSKPINVAYLAPSVTTYENYNPAYRIYYVDGDHENTTREIIDHETWTMDLQKANEGNNEPIWYRLYSAKYDYQMKSLRAEEWDNLLKKMIRDKDMFKRFYRNYYRNSPMMPYCDAECKIQILCDLKSAKSQSRRQLCNELEYL